MEAHASLTLGYALCTPSGFLLGHTYRQTPEESIAVVFNQDATAWTEACGRGFSVRKVMTHVTEIVTEVAE
jgi:hypothetical protein